MQTHTFSSFEKGFKLSGIIYLHRISDYKMGGISRRNFSMFRKLCGDQNLKNVLIVTNMWSEVSPAVGEARELELMTDDLLFKPAYDKGARFERHNNTVECAHSIIRRIIKNHPETLRIQQELVEEKKDIVDVEAFAVLDKDMEKIRTKHKEELQALQYQLDLALRNKDTETQDELRAVRTEMIDRLAAMNKKHEALSKEYREEKRRADAKIQELVVLLNDERQRATEAQRRFEELDADRRKENQQMLHTLRLMQDRMEQQAVQARMEREHQLELERRELMRLREENERMRYSRYPLSGGERWLYEVPGNDSDDTIAENLKSTTKRKKKGFMKKLFRY